MGLTVEQIGRLMAYAIQEHSFEAYLRDQQIPPEDQAEAKLLWDDTKQTMADHPGMTIMPVNDW